MCVLEYIFLVSSYFLKYKKISKIALWMGFDPL